MRSTAVKVLIAVALGQCFFSSGCSVGWRGKDEGERRPLDPVASETARAHFNSGVKYAMVGRYHYAIEAYREAIRIQPDDAMARYGLAVAYLLSGNLVSASDECKALKELDKELANRLFAIIDKEEEANIELCRHKMAVRIRPDDAVAYCRLGMAYSKLGRHEEAIEAYKQAIRIMPDVDGVYYNMGEAYSELGRYLEAIEAYKQAIRLISDDADAHYKLGVAYAKLGRRSEAIEAFNRVVDNRPDDTDAHYLLGVTYGKLGRHNDAIEAFNQVILINPDYSSAHYGLGMVYLSLGKARSALEEYDILRRLDREKADKLFNSIFVNEVLGGRSPNR
ncbi:MAG: tetratricopeptide repeat protein [Candidatus Tritonobacter lacicola]|nr:tetratricopeptide repeat protein [Candidatus Tritonobacter lacicola]